MLLLLVGEGLRLVDRRSNGSGYARGFLDVTAVLGPLETEEVGNVGECRDMEQQHDGADAGNSRYHRAAFRTRDGCALVDNTMAGVYGAAVVVAVRIHRDDKTGTVRGVGAQTRQPQDDQEEVQRQHRPCVIAGAACCRMFCENRIERDDPGENTLFEFKESATGHGFQHAEGFTYSSDGEALWISIVPMDEEGRQGHDDQCHDDLRDAETDEPSRRRDDCLAFLD